jgi:hypothetical protein
MTKTLRKKTSYAEELQRTTIGEMRVERIFIFAEDQEEIRLSWWPKGRFANKPVDLPETMLADLIAKAINEGTISRRFLEKVINETS